MRLIIDITAMATGLGMTEQEVLKGMDLKNPVMSVEELRASFMSGDGGHSLMATDNYMAAIAHFHELEPVTA
jgi:hypothetical protein